MASTDGPIGFLAAMPPEIAKLKEVATEQEVRHAQSGRSACSPG